MYTSFVFEKVFPPVLSPMNIWVYPQRSLHTFLNGSCYVNISFSHVLRFQTSFHEMSWMIRKAIKRIKADAIHGNFKKTTALVPSLSLIASFHNRASGFRGRVNARRVTERVCGKISPRRKIAVSRIWLPGTKATISPEWNGSSAPNFERARQKGRKRGIRRNIQKYFCRLIPKRGDVQIRLYNMLLWEQRPEMCVCTRKMFQCETTRTSSNWPLLELFR